MQRIAVLADIHGNLPALEAVVTDIESQEIDQVVVAGDLVGRGPQGTAVVARVAELGWPALRGNHEDYLLSFRRREVPQHWFSDRSWSAARWMADELTGEAERFIAELPLSLSLPVDPGVVVVHGTPSSNNRGLGAWSSTREVERSLAEIPGRMLLCAHTHNPMHRTVASGEVVNVGAVGLPFNGDRRAQFVVLHRGADGWEPEFRRIDYDLEEILAIYDSSGFLVAGGITSRLLKIELQRARPYLVPFLAWARAYELPSEAAIVDRFIEDYQECGSLRDFYRRLPRAVEPPTVGAPRRVESAGEAE